MIFAILTGILVLIVAEGSSEPGSYSRVTPRQPEPTPSPDVVAELQLLEAAYNELMQMERESYRLSGGKFCAKCKLPSKQWQHMLGEACGISPIHTSSLVS